MKFPSIVAALTALVPLSTHAVSIYNSPFLGDLPLPFMSFESNIEVSVGHDPVNTYWCTNGFNRGYMGIQVNSPTERRVLFSLWNKDAENLATIVEVGKNVQTSKFGHEGTGSHAWLVHDWKAGETQRLKVTAEFKGNDTIYGGYYWLDNEWYLIAKILGPNYGNEGLGYFYQFLENFGKDTSQTRRALRAGLNPKMNGVYMAIDGEGDGPDYNRPPAYTKLQYDNWNLIWQPN
ncbi:hypothetical protein K493DRAFT_321832 [Basidiobolus meristosporus CBS 931.73]|uniref:Uncharacterized protein n=1 Tax=Basidiobolus meristosporus CBS 931.73 TaxID=1314790 RepID=A0A1Y1W2U9_9FUNG|nr:hypothetical protein K493DRAFT_321832 [Basidiobolus meristosporus CBS 931.73]|eukprot:ORX67702.1 hypothetical protein K493DRAFT_321832 [Basidiobolus meristosporus CBS 931.73]